MKAVLGAVLISQEDIRRRISAMAGQISADYAGRPITLIAILKGSFMFLADLMRQISPEIPVEIDFMSISSYGDGTISSGSIRLERDLTIPIENKDVVIVEDIVDTGLTLANVCDMLSRRGTRSIRVATLLQKPGDSKLTCPLHYVGFRIPDKFVVGYGLDYAQRFRNLPDIRVLDEK